jgi:MOSC domain-containing protein YiiM
MGAQIVALFVSAKNREPLTARREATALADRGIEGDRHALPGNRRSVLFMPLEVLDQFHLRPGDVREQVTTRGVDLHALPVGARLHAGEAEFELMGPCAPCERMDELRPGLQAALEGRRGRFARVVTAGRFAVGDALRIEAP